MCHKYLVLVLESKNQVRWLAWRRKWIWNMHALWMNWQGKGNDFIYIFYWQKLGYATYNIFFNTVISWNTALFNKTICIYYVQKRGYSVIFGSQMKLVLLLFFIYYTIELKFAFNSQKKSHNSIIEFNLKLFTYFWLKYFQVRNMPGKLLRYMFVKENIIKQFVSQFKVKIM